MLSKFEQTRVGVNNLAAADNATAQTHKQRKVLAEGDEEGKSRVALELESWKACC